MRRYTRNVTRTVLVILAAIACQPKQPLQPSYFSATRPAGAPATCGETLACYDACQPLTEECMLTCDQQGAPADVTRAREASYCIAQSGCGDRTCADERCAPQLSACNAPPRVPAPSPMRPAPAMQPPPAGPPPPPPPSW